MIQWIRALSCCLALTGALALVTTGCTPSKDAAKADANKKDKDKDKDRDDHGHGETGPHHGALAEWSSRVRRAKTMLFQMNEMKGLN